MCGIFALLNNNDTLDECVKVRKKKRKSNRYRIILNNYLNTKISFQK